MTMSGSYRRPASCAPLGLLVAVLFASGCSLILDFSDKADAGPNSDADVVDAGPVGDGGDPCAAFEPNDALAEAYPIEPGTYSPLAICPSGDDDYFSFVLAEARDMVVEALFDNQGGAGDLEMRLYNSLGEIIANSQNFEDNERIERSLAQSNQLQPGTYIVQMYGFNGTVQNDYVLTLTFP
jgi:hypothetical protein